MSSKNSRTLKRTPTAISVTLKREWTENKHVTDVQGDTNLKLNGMTKQHRTWKWRDRNTEKKFNLEIRQRWKIQ